MSRALDEAVDVAGVALVSAAFGPADARRRATSFSKLMIAISLADGIVERDDQRLIKPEIGQMVIERVIKAAQKHLVSELGPALPREGRDVVISEVCNAFRDSAIDLVDLICARRFDPTAIPRQRVH